MLNISPGSLMDFCRVVAIRTGTRDPPSADSAAGIRTPCNGRPAQEQEARAKIKAPVARSRPAALASLRTVRRRLTPVWKMEASQDNSQRPSTDQTSDFLSISLSRNACSPAHFGTSIQINGDRNEMLDYVPHDPAIMEFVWQLIGIARSQY